MVMEVLSKHLSARTEEYHKICQYRCFPEGDSNQGPAKYKSYSVTAMQTSLACR
jgi:hypothetical protein